MSWWERQWHKMLGGPVSIGGAGSLVNYTNFDTTGHQTMAGAAKPWEDLRIEPVVRGTGALAPTFSKWFDDAPGTSIGVFLYTFNDLGKKEVHFTMQLPHAYDGGPLELHVHWVGSSSVANAHPIWGLEHTWKNVGSTYGDTTLQFSDGSNYTLAGVVARSGCCPYNVRIKRRGYRYTGSKPGSGRA
jgi:hypothetical protein